MVLHGAIPLSAILQSGCRAKYAQSSCIVCGFGFVWRWLIFYIVTDRCAVVKKKSVAEPKLSGVLGETIDER